MSGAYFLDVQEGIRYVIALYLKKWSDAESPSLNFRLGCE
jgi:hypothetical protein